MLNVNAIVVRQSYGFIKLAWDHSIHGEHPGHTLSSYYLYRINDVNKPELISQIAPHLTNFKYSLSLQDRGKTIRLGISVYDIKTQATSDITFLPPIATIPNPPELLMVKRQQDNIVSLEWLLPAYRSEIRGYLVERSTDQLFFDVLDIASGTSYIDLGSRFRAPLNSTKYYYRVSAITYAGIQSAYITTAVDVELKHEAPVPTLATKKIIDLPNKNYRIKAIGVDAVGETPWLNIHTAMMETQPGFPEIPSIRLRTITQEGDTSLVVKIQSIMLPLDKSCVVNDEAILINNDQDEALAITLDGTLAQKHYRIRTVSVDGLESHALLATIVHHIKTPNYIVNKTIDYVTSKERKKMINKGS